MVSSIYKITSTELVSQSVVAEVLVMESNHDVFKLSSERISYVPFDKLLINLSFGFLICLAECLVKTTSQNTENNKRYLRLCIQFYA